MITLAKVKEFFPNIKKKIYRILPMTITHLNDLYLGSLVLLGPGCDAIAHRSGFH
jgi:hypothetical protein